jgi:hypothetical protein
LLHPSIGRPQGPQPACNSTSSAICIGCVWSLDVFAIWALDTGVSRVEALICAIITYIGPIGGLCKLVRPLRVVFGDIGPIA